MSAYRRVVVGVRLRNPSCSRSTEISAMTKKLHTIFDLGEVRGPVYSHCVAKTNPAGKSTQSSYKSIRKPFC